MTRLTVHPADVDPDTARFHFYRPLADESVIVADRVLGGLLILYTARTNGQFSGGHQAQRWYARAVGDDAVNTPKSRPFDTFEAAAQAIRDGSWDLISSHADRRAVRARPCKPDAGSNGPPST